MADDSGLWREIEDLAKAKRKQQIEENPPQAKKGKRKFAGRGGQRANSGRKKSIPKVRSYFLYLYSFQGVNLEVVRNGKLNY